MKEMEIVKALPIHIPDIMKIEEQSFTVPWSKESYIQELEENERAKYFCAIKEGKVIGYSGMWVILDEGHITNVAVAPDMRKMGVGLLLVNTLISYAKNNNIYSLTLEVRKSNIAALKLYEKLGFVKKGTRRKYYSDNGESAIIMWLDNI